MCPGAAKLGGDHWGQVPPPTFFKMWKSAHFFEWKCLFSLIYWIINGGILRRNQWDFLTVMFKITYCNLHLYVALCCALLVWHHKCASTYLYLILYIIELSKAQRSFANVLSEFRLECIGEIDTDDEMEIGMSLIWLLLKVLYWI